MTQPILRRITCPAIFLLVAAAIFFSSLPVLAQPVSDNSAAAMSANFCLNQLFGTNACIAKCAVKIVGDDFREAFVSGFALRDGKTRTEMIITPSKDHMIPPGMDQEIIIQRPDLKLDYLLFPRLKAFIKNTLTSGTPDATMEKTNLDKDVIDGHPCVKYKVVVTAVGGKQYESTVWIASDLNHFPVQIQTTEEESSATETYAYQQIKFVRPEAALFEVPAGFTEYPSIDVMVEKNEGKIDKLDYLSTGSPADRLATVVDFTMKSGTNRPVRAATAIALGLGSHTIPAIQIALGSPNQPLVHMFGVSSVNSNDLFIARIDRTARTGVVWLTSRSGVLRATLETSTNAPVKVANRSHADEFEQEVQMLLETTAPPPWEDAPHPLNVASKFGTVADVEKILKGNIKHINDQDDDGNTPLANAVVQEQIDVVKLLLDHGADPNISNKNGDTPLGYAASRNGTNGTLLCEWLLAKGAIVNPTNKTEYRITPLDWAISSDNTELVKILLDAGASVKAKNDNGDTPLDAAADRGDLEIAQMLIAHGADVNAKITGGTTPLMKAAGNGHVDIIKLLLDHGADVNFKRSDGLTALVDAAGAGAEHHGKECVELLLDKGADIKATDGNGETVLIKAAYYGNTDVVVLLIAKGADVNAKSKNGKTPLNVATKPEIINLLKQHGAK